MSDRPWMPQAPAYVGHSVDPDDIDDAMTYGMVRNVKRWDPVQQRLVDYVQA